MGRVFLFDGHGGEGAVERGDVGGGAGGLCAFSAGPSALGGGGHVGVEGGELLHHALVLVLLVGVDGLGVLAEVVEAGKLL